MSDFMLADRINSSIEKNNFSGVNLKPYMNADQEEKNYYGHGIWVYKKDNAPIEEYITGCDAGVSFKSAMIRQDEIIYTVISNTGDGAWPIIDEIKAYFCI